MRHTAIENKGRIPQVIAVCGVKNSGKTTLLARLIGELTKRGAKVAVVKHDGHDFSCDVPGTDSDRLHRAGAYGTAVFSKNRIFLHKEVEGALETDLIRQFPEADLIFLEGLKNSAYPKIEVVRRAISKKPVSNPEGRFLIVTDCSGEEIRQWEIGQERIVDFEHLEEMIEEIISRRESL